MRAYGTGGDGSGARDGPFAAQATAARTRRARGSRGVAGAGAVPCRRSERVRPTMPPSSPGGTSRCTRGARGPRGGPRPPRSTTVGSPARPLRAGAGLPARAAGAVGAPLRGPPGGDPFVRADRLARPLYGYAPKRGYVSASVIKAMLLVAYLRSIGPRLPSRAERGRSAR